MGGKVTGTLWVVVILLSVGIVFAYTGSAPVVTQSQLPGGPTTGFGAVAGLLATTWVVTKYLNASEWRQMGRSVDLQPAGSLNPLGKPDLEGEVNRHRVRVNTHTINTKHGNDKRYTVVEAALHEPVEWSAIVSPVPDVTEAGRSTGIGLNDEAAARELDSIHATTVDGEFAVVGELTQDQAGELLTPEVRRTLETLGAEVSVGETEQMMVSAMADSMPEEKAKQSLTGEMLSTTQDGDDGPTTDVVHRDRNSLQDGDELRRRVDAITAVANAVDRVDAGQR